jgi:hypothetical protein
MHLQTNHILLTCRFYFDGLSFEEYEEKWFEAIDRMKVFGWWKESNS